MLRSAGYTVISVKGNYPGEEDEKLVLIAKEKGYVFVTEDVRAADAAKFHDIKYIQIDLTLKAKAVKNELDKIMCQ